METNEEGAERDGGESSKYSEDQELCTREDINPAVRLDSKMSRYTARSVLNTTTH